MTPTLTPAQSAVVAYLEDATEAAPRSLRDIQEHLYYVRGDLFAERPTEREVKGIMERLCSKEVNLPIGSSRGNPHGWWWVRSADEAERAARPIFRQAVAMLRRAERLTGGARVREWLGQEGLVEAGEGAGVRV